MDTYVIEQLKPFQTDHTLVPSPESQDRFAMYIVMLPAPTPRPTATAPTHDTGDRVTDTFADDIAEATWEDAEWR